MSMPAWFARSPVGAALSFERILERTLRDTLRLRKNPSREEVAQITLGWGRYCCEWTGIRIATSGPGPYTVEPCLYVSNHVGYLDIPLLMSQMPLTFVAKTEVEQWPLFGAGAAAAGTVFVKRDNMKSRQSVLEAIGKAIAEDGKSIALFPEGTSSMGVLPFKKGGFAVAMERGFKVQPIRIHYRPMRRAAFIKDDSFSPHYWKVLREGGLDASIEYFEARNIKDLDADLKTIENLIRDSFNKIDGQKA